MLASFPGGLKSEDLLTATGPGLDGLSYHFYGGVSKRCSAMGQPGQTSPEAALSAGVARRARSATPASTPRCATASSRASRCGSRRRARPACGGNPWASTFVDSFRYVEQLGRLAKMGVQVVMHNTLAASDYALIDEETLEPRPSYWAALLWRRLMGRTVLDAGPSPAPGVDVYAHCLAGKPGGVALLAVNTDRNAAHDLTLPIRGERYTLASAEGLLSHSVQLNGKTAAVGKDDVVPVLRGTPTPRGPVALPAASITFVALGEAANASCR